MGVSDDCKDTHRRDPISAYIRSWRSHPSRDRPYQLSRSELHGRQKRRSYAPPLDLVDEALKMAKQRLAWYQNLMSKHYNARVRHRDFQIGDLVLRKVMGAAKDPTQGKLRPNWEGPYRITSWQRKGTYHLETMDERKLQHPWNTEHLRKYYQ